VPTSYGADTYGTDSYGELVGGLTLRTGVQETNSTNNPIDLANCPAGAVRLMTNAVSEVTGRANRTKAVWDAGLWPIPCLKTQAVGTAADYETQVTAFLDIIAPVGGPVKSQVFEVGNEPGAGTYPPGTDLAYYLDCLHRTFDLIRSRGLKVVLAAMTLGATYTPPGGAKLYGPAAVSRAITNGYRGVNWSMIDGFALHNYGDSVATLISSWANQRNLFPADKEMLITENGWPTGSGGPFLQNYDEPMRINRILDMWGNVSARAEAWNLRVWSFFANSDYGNASDAYERTGLVNLAGTKKSGAAVTRPAGSFGAGETFTKSWDALDFIPKETTIGTPVPPPPPPPAPPPPPPVASSPTLPSPRLIEAVKKSHTLAVKAEVLQGGEVVTELPITGGSVTFDSKASVRATCDLTLADDGSLGWIPNAPTDPLAPYGNEVRVWRGVHFGEDDEELVSLGIFRIDEIEATDKGELRLTGSDRAAAVSDAKFEAPYSVIRGTLFTDAIRNVVTDAIGPVQTSFIETTITTPALVAEEGEDRWEFVSGLAQALKAELYFDSDGVLVLAPVPEPTDDPMAELVEGEGGVLLEASKRWSRTDAFNKVIVSGENTDINPPVRAEAWDNNPLSPTYYFGSFGKVPRFWSNQFVTTQPQAQAAAEGILLAELGITQQVDFGSVVDPTLRASDVVLIRRAQIGVSGAHVIDSLTIPLDAESSMTGQTRLVYPLTMIESKPEHLLLSPETLLFPEQVLF
jgi:hypothetical protein